MSEAGYVQDQLPITTAFEIPRARVDRIVGLC